LKETLLRIIENDGVCFSCGKCAECYEYLCAHHIKSRGAGGSDDPKNIITVCLECHNKLHNGEIKEVDILKKYKGTKYWRWDIKYVE
jgi:5-methylcytosine-specific restriction endonuclease McrA